MASAAALLSSGGNAFLMPVEPAAAPRAVPQTRAAQADLVATPIASSNLAGSSPSWTAWGCLAAAAVAAGSAGTRKASRAQAQRRRLLVRNAAAADDEEAPRAVSRADLLRGLGGAGASSLLLPMAPEPAHAASLEGAQKTLTSYGLGDIPLQSPPWGWSIAVEPIGLAPDAYYGKFKLGSEPQVVVFNVPPLWVVSKPNIDYNGAAGTVQANDYGKGDSATLWVDTEFKGELAEMKKQDFKAELTKALTTKGKDFIESLKIDTIKDGAPGYKIIDYTYDVESAAGFTIARSGIASVAQVGEAKHLQILWTAVVTGRYKDMQNDLKGIVGSFRIASVPKGISASMVKEFKNMDEAMSAADIPQAKY